MNISFAHRRIRNGHYIMSLPLKPKKYPHCARSIPPINVMIFIKTRDAAGSVYEIYRAHFCIKGSVMEIIQKIMLYYS